MPDRTPAEKSSPVRPTWASGYTADLPQLCSPSEPAGPSTATASIAGNAMIVASAFILSRLLGMVREMVIAARFGTSPNYDAYVAAFRIPDLLFLVVMSGAFGSAFIPIFGAFLMRGSADRAWRLASAILSYTLVALAATAAVVLLLAGVLMREIVAPGLAPEQRQLATDLTRFLLLSPLLLGLGAAFKGMLEAQERFALSAYAPIFYNLSIIVGAVALVPWFGVFGLAGGVVLGASLHAGIQAVGLWRGGMRLRFTLDRSTDGLASVLRLMAPRVLGQAAFQVNFIVMTNFASKLGDSRVGALNYAFQLLMLPHGVLALSLSTVIFPMLARQFESGRLDEMRSTLTRALAPLVFLTLPASVGLLCFRTSLVQVLFEFGSFDQRSTHLVSDALGWFALALLGLSIVEATTRVFYAMQDTLTPVIASVSTIAINIVLSALLAPRMGHGGLALSFALTGTGEMVILLVVLQRRLGDWSAPMRASLARSIAATLFFAPVAWWMGSEMARATDPSTARGIGGYLFFGFGLTTAGLVYVAAAWLLGSREVLDLGRRVPVMNRIVIAVLAPRYRDTFT